MVLRSKLQKYIESSTVYILKEMVLNIERSRVSKIRSLKDNRNRSDNKDRKIRDGHMVRSWDCDRDKSMWRI